MNALTQFRPKLESADGSSHASLETMGRLVGGVAHDFNNLLTGVVLCSDLLLAGLEAESPLRRYAQEIRLAAARGTDLIQQLLNGTRTDSDSGNALSLNEAISNLHDLLLRLMGENIEVIIHLENDLAAIRMQPAQAQQIILNLMMNARDAMPEGGQITISTRSGRTSSGLGADTFHYVELEVSDNGCGMDETTRARAFEPFFTKKRGGNHGIGLVTVASIVERCNGVIAVESETGKGTRVTVRFPGQAANSDDGGAAKPCAAAQGDS